MRLMGFFSSAIDIGLVGLILITSRDYCGGISINFLTFSKPHRKSVTFYCNFTFRVLFSVTLMVIFIGKFVLVTVMARTNSINPSIFDIISEIPVINLSHPKYFNRERARASRGRK